MSRSAKRIRFVLGLATLLLAAQADARTELLQFTHPDPSSVDTFRVYVGSGTGQSDLLSEPVTPLGPPNSAGTFTFVIELESQATLFIRMTAVADSLESEASNEIQRRVPLGLPGQPTVVLP